jgi:hypothetical protein
MGTKKHDSKRGDAEEPDPIPVEGDTPAPQDLEPGDEASPAPADAGEEGEDAGELDFDQDNPFGDEFEPPTEEEISEENRWLERRQREFRTAAQFVARAFARVSGVERVTLFGSVAAPLRHEIPRFRRFRRHRQPLLHECKDVDLAVHLRDLSRLNELKKARARALRDLLEVHDIGVAHHQVDVFVLEPGTGRYLGRLCEYKECPAGKPACLVPGCGATPWVKVIEGFALDPGALTKRPTEVLFEASGVGGTAP